MAGHIATQIDVPINAWELEFIKNNFNIVFDLQDWKGWCDANIADDRLQLAMNHAQTCGMIEVGLYQDAVEAAKRQGLKENVDFGVLPTSSYLVMGQTERFEHTDEDRRKHLMTMLSQARDQRAAKEKLEQLMEEHAVQKAKKSGGGGSSA